MLKRVHNVFYWTKDLDEAVAFYRDVLGLSMRLRIENDWAEFDVGGTTVAVHGTRGGSQPPYLGATVVFEVDDLDATMRALYGRGVRFEGEVTEVPESGRFASFVDPAGNVVQIFEIARGSDRE
jgi:predicted enzyme related to lactoylglutathione lyase